MIPDRPLDACTEVLVELTRGPVVESIHRGAAVVSDTEGRVLAWIGDPDLATYVRSAAKPFQALALFESGANERFHIPPDELAIVIASHSGEDFHIRLVELLQQRTGVRPEWLLCGPQPPFDTETRTAMIRSGVLPTPMHNNCSGKHTGMLAAALAMGAPVESYNDPTHPVQTGNVRRLADLSGMRPEAIGIGVDGCSAPAFRLPLSRFATAFARLTAAGAAGAREHVTGLKAAWDAMVTYPEIIAGTHERLDTDLMRAARDAGIPLVAKAGAEGTYAMGVLTSDGPVGIALKIEDGGERGRNAVAIECLHQIGALPEAMAMALAGYHRSPLRNRAGHPVGEIRPSFQLSRMPPPLSV